MSRKVTIHSDGTGHGTVVLDEDGNKVGNVTEVNFNIEANSVSDVVITVKNVGANVQGDVTTVLFQCPLCYESNEHVCDETLGRIAGFQQCDSFLMAQDPMTRLNCIREAGHDKSHFDGDRTWG